MRKAGYHTVKVDFVYFERMRQSSRKKRRGNYMDILTPSGFMQLGSIIRNLVICLRVFLEFMSELHSGPPTNTVTALLSTKSGSGPHYVWEV